VLWLELGKVIGHCSSAFLAFGMFTGSTFTGAIQELWPLSGRMWSA
jgi:hypothetical protein